MATLPVLTFSAFSAAAVAMAYLVYFRNYNKATFMYLLYAHTPVGRMFHASAIDKHRQALEGSSPASALAKLSGPKYNFNTKNALVRIVPFLSDNYAYILVCKATKTAAIVDPADAQVVFSALEGLERDLGTPVKVSSILTTHYHHDHAGGNKEIVSLLEHKLGGSNIDLQVIGGANETFPGVAGATRHVKHGDKIQVGNLTVNCLEVPCHTWGSVLFLCENLCFTGDYLFSGGCGRFFEGGAKDFCDSLNRSVVPLSDDVLMFPGHEYTVSNLKFAKKVLTSNADVDARLEQAMALRNEDVPTIPSSFGDERKYNVFIRAADQQLLDETLINRTMELVAEAKELSVSSGTDRHDKSTSKISLSDEPSNVEVVRALRALKDRA